MIGQENNKRFIDICVATNKLPRFLLIRGDVGSGKKTLANYVANKSGYDIAWFSPSIESVRNIINVAYQQTRPIIYAIYDCDKLSNQAANALLKIAEEPPTNAYIILTVSDDSLLGTIKSRGTMLSVEMYSNDEKLLACKDLNITDNVEEKLNISETIGDLVLLNTIDFESANKLCDNIVSNINKANICSALKITKKLKLKEKDETGLDILVFIKMLLHKYYEQALKTRSKYYIQCWNVVFEAKKQLVKSLNKQYIVDEMLLSLRRVTNESI